MSIYRTDTISDLLRSGAAKAPAIGAPGRKSLSFADLRALIEKTVNDLNSFGIGRNERVAIVLPNGPEMATTFLAVASGATAAPLNPAYRAKEFEFYLTDLHAKALIVLEGMETQALSVAEKLRIPVFRLVPDDTRPAGSFKLGAPSRVASRPTGDSFAADSDVALVLHTSGTTSRPKIVPLTHVNLTVSAHNIAGALALSEDDVCLNIMPLFHIHGLVAATLASLAAGGTVSCTPGFNALKVFSWLDEIRPSWYTAVPTMHQAILSRAGRHEDIVRNTRLRFVRSSSSSLPAPVMAQLEAVFGVPVIEAYGMTEAAHQMTSNPLPPAPRYAGSVGVAAGLDVRIMDEAGMLLPAGNLGEVVIRGRNVTGGYDANPEANAKAFANGWFRTGDQGVMDDAGYLRLTGRLKELINRGGEKISPLEIDAVLMDHPGVAQAITFAVAHAKLGEDVAAAVVLHEGASCGENELRVFASARLADFKVPRRILFLQEIPKGATGKLQRIGLAQKLGLGE